MSNWSAPSSSEKVCFLLLCYLKSELKVIDSLKHKFVILMKLKELFVFCLHLVSEHSLYFFILFAFALD